MSHTILLHALAKGETREYMMNLITAKPDNEEGRALLAKARAWAEGEGFHSFRETKIEDGVMPDFTKAVNV